ncbi:MAG: 2-dehydropantoate 2-reductase [Deltaproteobacteria bacterium]|nr:2-dehydropantoate 2-reductase [Deltaproteobacteria bacterium]
MSIRFAVFGSGGVGGYFGGRLAQTGHDVTFIARGAHLTAMKQQGLRVKSPLGDFHLQPVKASSSAQEVGPVDVVLVAVKAWQVPAAAETIQPLLGKNTFVLPLQNGVEAPSQLASVLGEQRILGGLCKIISLVAEPGTIHHLGAEPYIALGELSGDLTPRCEKLAAALRGAGIKVDIPVGGDDTSGIEAAMWQKFLFIAAVSGIGAVTRAPLGTVRELPETRALLVAAMQEIVQVARALKIPLADGIIEKTLAFLDSLPPETTASMQRDLMEGRPSELEHQNGAVVRLGLQTGVKTPVNTTLYASLLPMERQARARQEGSPSDPTPRT